MSVRYVAQRDLDGTWSVREIASNRPAVLRSAVQLGLSEDLAAIRTRKLNGHIIEADDYSSGLAGAVKSLTVAAQ